VGLSASERGLTLTVLGCSGTYAAPGNACSGYLVQGAGATVWIDAGPGTLANLQRHVGLGSVDALVLTHSHPDHWLEVPVLRNALRFGVGLEGFRVLSTADVRGRAEALIDDPLSPPFDWSVIDEASAPSIGGLALRFSRTDHPVETLAVRVDGGGRSLAYTADTGPAWSLSSLGPGIHLALCEATLEVDEEGQAQHLSGRQAGTMAAAAGAERLLITHVMPTGDAAVHQRDARATFGGAVEIATIHETYEV
jgi:ribonuclease BN (tRNA processing enzyme)